MKYGCTLGDDRIPSPPKRSVRPRSRSFKPLPAVAIHGETVLYESGQVATLPELIRKLPQESPTLFCKLGAADFLGDLSAHFILKYGDRWQWRASNCERELRRPQEFIRATRVSVLVHYFGWKNGNYHKLIDPISMHGHRLSKMFPGEVTVVIDRDWETLVRLLKWGIAIRDFCQANDIEVRPTVGGIASQFLTDKRFYPKARRKVPATINQRTRENLPGNHYYLNVKPSPSNDYRAHYLDQHRAHHFHARNAALPDSDHCYAYGSYMDLAHTAFTHTDDSFCGLYCLNLRAPKVRQPFDWIGGGNLDEVEKTFVYSNELSHLRDMGYVIEGVIAAWGSRSRDTGLPHYAEWAEQELDRHRDVPWLKQLLLATYGTLAARSKYAEAVFRLASAGDYVETRTGHRKLLGRLTRSQRKLEPGIVNVLHRGMIEAGCRSESIGLAQWLNYQSHRILSIYADAVIVEVDDDKDLPELPEPWRRKRTLNHLQFINQQAFQSDGMTKLPGVTREIRGYRQHTTPGRAPRVIQYEALSGEKRQTDRRI